MLIIAFSLLKAEIWREILTAAYYLNYVYLNYYDIRANPIQKYILRLVHNNIFQFAVEIPMQKSVLLIIHFLAFSSLALKSLSHNILDNAFLK